jgi:RimJ/RimL family protein N-acetyltransferase
MTAHDPFGLPIGPPVLGWSERPRPPVTPLRGRWCEIEPLARDHATDLYAAFADDDGSMWTYMGYGPWPEADDFVAWVDSISGGSDPQFHAVIVGDEPQGLVAYLRVQPDVGVIEIGHISWSPRLRRTTAATEAIFLLMRRAFDELGYRRLEWKADALNQASAAAARRLGFTHEGVFRKATIYKGRNRDTAWFSIVDDDWPVLRESLSRWLEPANFDPRGGQIRSLSDM